jgi:hypothetical protein
MADSEILVKSAQSHIGGKLMADQLMSSFNLYSR